MIKIMTMRTSLSILFFATLLTGCGSDEKTNNDSKSTPKDQTLQAPEVIVAVGKVEPEKDIISISAPVSGIVKSVLKQEGDQVRAGEILVQLDDDLEQSRTNQIKAQVQSQRAQIEVEQTQWNEARANYENKNALLAKTKRLLENGAESQQNYDDLVTEVEVLNIKAERAKAGVQLATRKLNELLAELQTSEIEAGKKQLRSPFDGVVLDIQPTKGEAVNQFSTFAEFAPDGNLIVRAEVDELFSDQVKVGQSVEIVRTGSDRLLATGSIVLVSPYLRKKSLFSEKPDDQEDRRVREVRIALTDANNLTINSKVECKIKL